MDVSLKVTDQPQESSFFDMVSGDNVLSIPLFQRPYRWTQRNLDWLLDDVDDIKGGLTKSCFLGVVVCVARGASPGRPIPWEIVDGQQRLTTLYLLLLAATEVAAKKGDPAWACGVIGTYLLVRPLADNPVNTKLVPSFADRGQFKKIWDGIMTIDGVATNQSVIGNPPKPPMPSGGDEGTMISQFVRMRRRLQKLWDESGKEGLERLVEIATSKLSVVSISLRDPFVAPKIFERLNNRAELVTIADLVRNEVFAKVSDDPANAQHVFANHWEPFNIKFEGIKDGLEKFLFPYGLILNKQLTKADLFTQIRSHWNAFERPDQIISDMERYVNCFLSLESGRKDITLSPPVTLRLDRIYRVGKPSSTYAFIMKLIWAMKEQQVPEEDVAQILGVLESFLFRRAIGGIEPTGLHAVFKGLWAELTDSTDAPGISANSVMDAIRKKPTVAWPSDTEFREAILTGNLYSRKVNKYALREYETGCEGESPLDDFHIEHILPQTPTQEWSDVFGEDYEKALNTWANLVPITGRMNSIAGQAGFDVKREEYSDSIFATTRAVASDYEDWTMTELEARGAAIAAWAVTRWPYGGSV